MTSLLSFAPSACREQTSRRWVYNYQGHSCCLSKRWGLLWASQRQGSCLEILDRDLSESGISLRKRTGEDRIEDIREGTGAAFDDEMLSGRSRWIQA